MPMLKKRKGESTSQNAVRSEVTKMNQGKLHSGSKRGPKVTNRKQAIAIGLSEARKKGAKVPGKTEPTKEYKRGAKMANRRKRNIGRS